MRKIWVIPAVILVALIVSGFFRYDEVASKTTEDVFYKWKVDRWTQNIWLESFSTSGTAQEKVINSSAVYSEKARATRDAITSAWRNSLIIASLWLVVGLAWPKSKKERRSNIDA